MSLSLCVPKCANEYAPTGLEDVVELEEYAVCVCVCVRACVRACNALVLPLVSRILMY
jgi:hypothetical protein